MTVRKHEELELANNDELTTMTEVEDEEIELDNIHALNMMIDNKEEMELDNIYAHNMLIEDKDEEIAKSDHIVLCGYIKHLQINQNIMNMTIDDGSRSISLSMFTKHLPKELKTYLSENMMNLQQGKQIKTPNQDLFNRELLRFQSLINSLAYVENLKLEDLILVMGEAIVQEGIVVFETSKMIRILDDQEEYLQQWKDSAENYDLLQIRT